MKIVFLIRYLGIGGAERQMIILAKGLKERGNDVAVAVFYPGGPLEDELRQAGVPIEFLGKRHRWEVLGFLVRLIRLMRRLNPDVIHGYLDGPNLLTIFLKPFLPRALMVWSIRASNLDLKRFNWLRAWTYQGERLLSRFADLIISNSKAGRDDAVENGFPRRKVAVIPNGIDTRRFHPDRSLGARLRCDWNVPEESLLIGLVGRLDPRKDHPTFLKAAALFAAERGDTRFVCVGDGDPSYLDELRKMGADLGLDDKLIWAGAVREMPSVYNALDLGVSCSAFGEGFSNVVGEIMACGVPCVVTDVGDSAWIVKNADFVVAPRSPEALAEAWKRCLSQNRDAIAQNSRARIVEEFSVERLIDSTEKLLAACVWIKNEGADPHSLKPQNILN
jgi:glycosyltransferase involved in cell wall biosynthesis